MPSFNKNKSKAEKRRKERDAEQRVELQKKIRRQLYATASSNKRLEKEISMKKTLKRHSRRNPKYQGVSQVNYDLF